MADSKQVIKQHWEEAKLEYEALGGWKALKSGEWFWRLIQKSFNNYWERGTAEYFRDKYGTTDPEKLAPKLIKVTAKNASILGAVTGAAISADEVVAILTGGEFGVGLPANIAFALAGLSAEAILLTRFHLQLVANLGKAYGAPLDPDDPEDILTILAFAFGGTVADAAGKMGMRIGSKMAGQVAKGVFQKEVLAMAKKLAARIGVRILQRTIVKYTIPFASIAIGTGWNYLATKAVGKFACEHFKKRIAELSPSGDSK